MWIYKIYQIICVNLLDNSMSIKLIELPNELEAPRFFNEEKIAKEWIDSNKEKLKFRTLTIIGSISL